MFQFLEQIIQIDKDNNKTTHQLFLYSKRRGEQYYADSSEFREHNKSLFIWPIKNQC